MRTLRISENIIFTKHDVTNHVIGALQGKLPWAPLPFNPPLRGCSLDVTGTGVPGNCSEGSATFDPVFKFSLIRIWILSNDNNQAQEARTTAVYRRRTSGVSV